MADDLEEHARRVQSLVENLGTQVLDQADRSSGRKADVSREQTERALVEMSAQRITLSSGSRRSWLGSRW